MSVDRTDERERIACIETFWTAVYVRLWKIGDFVRTFFLYYMRSPRFFLSDLFLLARYFFTSPYRLLRLYDEGNDEQALGPYGETPFYTLEKICRAFSISPDWEFLDIGAGRGRALLWLHFIRKQKRCIGVEPFLPFCRSIQRVIQFFKIHDVKVVHNDGYAYLQEWKRHKTDFSKSVVYLYISSMDDDECRRIGMLLSDCKGLHIVTISFWLGEYDMPNIQLIQTKTTSFPWGKAEVYYQEVI